MPGYKLSLFFFCNVCHKRKKLTCNSGVSSLMFSCRNEKDKCEYLPFKFDFLFADSLPVSILYAFWLHFPTILLILVFFFSTSPSSLFFCFPSIHNIFMHFSFFYSFLLQHHLFSNPPPPCQMTSTFFALHPSVFCIKLMRL